MGKYLIKRFLVIIPVFLGITVLVYCMASLAPGSPIELLMSDPFATEMDIERKRQELGLDQPIIIQYLTWLGQLLNWSPYFSEPFRNRTALRTLRQPARRREPADGGGLHVAGDEQRRLGAGGQSG